MEHWRIDDALDVSSVHGVIGIIGALAIGIIASTRINPEGLDGLLFGNPIQLSIQALVIAVAGALSLGATIAIMKIIDKKDNRAQGQGSRRHWPRHCAAHIARVCQLTPPSFSWAQNTNNN